MRVRVRVVRVRVRVRARDVRVCVRVCVCQGTHSSDALTARFPPTLLQTLQHPCVQSGCGGLQDPEHTLPQLPDLREQQRHPSCASSQWFTALGAARHGGRRPPCVRVRVRACVRACRGLLDSALCSSSGRSPPHPITDGGWLPRRLNGHPTAFPTQQGWTTPGGWRCPADGSRAGPSPPAPGQHRPCAPAALPSVYATAAASPQGPSSNALGGRGGTHTPST